MWFSVSIFLKASNSTDPSHQMLWEERILLIRAVDEAEARKKAEALGQKLGHEYLAQGATKVHWKFERINTVYEIEAKALEDGTELFWRFLRPSEVASLSTPFGE